MTNVILGYKMKFHVYFLYYAINLTNSYAFFCSSFVRDMDSSWSFMKSLFHVSKYLGFPLNTWLKSRPWACCMFITNVDQRNTFTRPFLKFPTYWLRCMWRQESKRMITIGNLLHLFDFVHNPPMAILHFILLQASFSLSSISFYRP